MYRLTALVLLRLTEGVLVYTNSTCPLCFVWYTAERMKTITIVLGTARAGRASEGVAKALQTAFAAQDATTIQYVDVAEHLTEPVTRPAWAEDGADQVSMRWKGVVAQTDAFVFILPEYNHSYPGEWKLLIDALGASAYTGKEAYIVGVSAGAFGGVRVADHVKPVLIELGLHVRKTALYVSHVKDVVDRDGVVGDTALTTRLQEFAAAVAGQTN